MGQNLSGLPRISAVFSPGPYDPPRTTEPRDGGTSAALSLGEVTLCSISFFWMICKLPQAWRSRLGSPGWKGLWCSPHNGPHLQGKLSPPGLEQSSSDSETSSSENLAPREVPPHGVRYFQKAKIPQPIPAVISEQNGRPQLL